MAGVKLSLFLLFLVAFEPRQAGLSCAGVCEIKRTGFCPGLGGISLRGSLPCATCNTTGQADENPLGCLPGDMKKLQVAGHSDRSGELKTLPRLGQLRNLILGPGSIRKTGRGAFAPVPNILALSMEKNAIKAVGSWFGEIAKLERLTLSRNEIEEIKENAFQPLRRLEYLDLRHNRLRAVEESHFSSLTGLVYLHLSYNNISHIAGRAFGRLSRLSSLTLDHNKISFLSTGWLQGLSAKNIRLNNNPFRCTCALGRASASLFGDRRDKMRCSYPPSLLRRKIADVPRREMPCPPPTAKVSRRDRGTTLVCEVFWEKRPEIRWMDPGGRTVGDRQAQDQCGGTVTTRLEHDYPTTQSPEGGQVLPTDAPSLPYIGRSTFTLHMNPQAYGCWTRGSYRCVVKSATTGSVVANLSLIKSSEQDPRDDHTVTTAAAYTSTPAQRNARMTERVAKTPDKNPRQDGITPAAEAGSMGRAKTKKPRQDSMTPAADKAKRRTVMAAVFTTKPTRQNGRVTGGMGKAFTDKNGQKDRTIPSDDKPLNIVMLVFVSVIGTFVTVGVADRVLARFKKWYEKRQEQRQNAHGYAAGAIGGIPLQNLQPPAAAPSSGNPAVPPQHAQDDIPDDASITPYAETSRLENPMYGADVTGPRGATSASPDPRPGPNRPANSKATSQPGGSGTTWAPVPPPRSDMQDNAASDSHYYPPAGADTTRARDVPAPLPRTNRHVNSNVSAQPRRLAERIPDPLPRTHTYINSNVSVRPKRMGMASKSRHHDNLGASYDPQGLRMDEEEKVEGPNLYLDLNGPPRHSDSQMAQPEDVPPPLPRTNRYVNSNVAAARPKSLGTGYCAKKPKCLLRQPQGLPCQPQGLLRQPT
ncbi:PREDICTED: LOW QUALITY PROTEIN: uncharacterized protein LOC109484503 [Branchiostoma belcheri]|uniref:LOW QUALITY PROTEIN: uncharacterized protein LOC109484503 n=1 Tax=Branchiostoma belcheri TaxID=7741 RepID=A0A6P5AMV8_BRABE|nr:PREDICTED: LOW QUALITY PROTEIN: uncharacterized protein LOC109484503 [Branchiostoma belcheri]